LALTLLAERGSMTRHYLDPIVGCHEMAKGGNIAWNSTHRVFPLGADVSADFVHMLHRNRNIRGLVDFYVQCNLNGRN
jgi:hypothetical protein